MNAEQTGKPGKSNNTVIIVVVVVAALFVLSCLGIGLLVAILMPALGAARHQARIVATESNLRQASIALTMYSTQWDAYPPADGWIDAVDNSMQGSGAPQLLEHALTPQDGRAFAMNDSLTLRDMADVPKPSRTVLLFECAAGSPAVGGKELLPTAPRGNSGYVIAFVDGHTERVPPQDIDSLVWDVPYETGGGSKP